MKNDLLIEELCTFYSDLAELEPVKQEKPMEMVPEKPVEIAKPTRGKLQIKSNNTKAMKKEETRKSSIVPPPPPPVIPVKEKTKKVIKKVCIYSWLFVSFYSFLF
jgi:hypothetical protein